MTPQDQLKLLTASDTAPAITDSEIEDLLAAHATADTGGLPPGNVAWTPTYDLNAAAAAGWLIKAARAAAMVEVDPPGSGIYTSQVFENCRKMAREFRAKGAMSIKVASPTE
jgi:hypothetical protein